MKQSSQSREDHRVEVKELRKYIENNIRKRNGLSEPRK